jgi:hypothetical protein
MREAAIRFQGGRPAILRTISLLLKGVVPNFLSH